MHAQSYEAHGSLVPSEEVAALATEARIWKYYCRVVAEERAVWDRLSALENGHPSPPPMPHPTPPFDLPLLLKTDAPAAAAEAAAAPPAPAAEAASAPPAPAALSSVGSVEPGTPVAGVPTQQGQRACRSSSEEGAPADGGITKPVLTNDWSDSDVTPLLGREAGVAERGLRRRHGLKAS